MVANDEKWAEIYENVRIKLSKRVKIVDRNNISIEEIDRMIKIANARMIWDNSGQTDVVIVDYFQYMKNTHNYEAASASARQMKAVAKDNNVLFIMLSQLSRQGSDWERPTMQMLKSTGDLEASADIILMAWRPGNDPNLSEIDKMALEDVIMVIIAKSRRGAEVTDFKHYFDRETTRIVENKLFP
jgi:replicative DNA helicase